MDLAEQLYSQKNKVFAEKLGLEAGINYDCFRKLSDLAFSSDVRALRASWALGFACERTPDFFRTIEDELIERIGQDGHPGISRNLLRVLTVIPVSERNEALLFDKCSRLFFHLKQPIAVRVYSLMICRQIAEKYPDLKPELKLMAESIRPEQGAGLNIVARKVLRQLAGVAC